GTAPASNWSGWNVTAGMEGLLYPGLAVPIECGRPVRKRSHALELAGVTLRRRKVERRGGGQFERCLIRGMLRRLRARRAEKQSQRHGGRAELQCTRRMHGLVPQARFPLFHQHDCLGILWAENPPRKGRNSCPP